MAFSTSCIAGRGGICDGLPLDIGWEALGRSNRLFVSYEP